MNRASTLLPGVGIIVILYSSIRSLILCRVPSVSNTRYKSINNLVRLRVNQVERIAIQCHRRAS